MRKLIVSMNLSLDGFVSGPDGGLEWHARYWSADMAEALDVQLAGADTMLLGRLTYNALGAYWMAKAGDPSCSREDTTFSMIMNSYAKVVVSSSPLTAAWGPTEMLHGGLGAGIRQLKQRAGADIITYGSTSLVAVLMRLRLVDEYQLWLHPIAISGGTLLFNGRDRLHQLKLVGVSRFSSGVVLLTYRPIADSLQ